MKKSKKFRRLKRYWENPRQRRERKAREYRLSLYRTMFSGAAAVCNAVGLILSALIFWKVWLHR